ncbi:hypothetical protein L596_023389 [Steinernema carpocapsae]|uniref:Uncharacterized protein n=1 Tax=Steinernema carpocapsae TaxID=34508 RepID=A0A4U5ME95_STECR|nr:hypothetical protein L596_023389 [Steinernema carpocapsae]
MAGKRKSPDEHGPWEKAVEKTGDSGASEHRAIALLRVSAISRFRPLRELLFVPSISGSSLWVKIIYRRCPSAFNRSFQNSKIALILCSRTRFHLVIDKIHFSRCHQCLDVDL